VVGFFGCWGGHRCESISYILSANRKGPVLSDYIIKLKDMRIFHDLPSKYFLVNLTGSFNISFGQLAEKNLKN
jgi:hypothetical protein